MSDAAPGYRAARNVLTFDVMEDTMTKTENSTDATRGEPLALRAEKRKAELQIALDKLPAADARARNDIELIVASIDSLLTGDVEHLSDATAAELSRLLEGSKHLAETPIPAPAPEPSVAVDGGSPAL